MTDIPQSPASSSGWVDHIPVLWYEPQVRRTKRQLIIFLTGLSDAKEGMSPYLQELAAAGFVALSFDPWQHGERGNESGAEILDRVFGNFRRHMWPILGQTVLDTRRVIDWAIASLEVESQVYMGGISMGGDIAVAAAGLDHRIERVAAIVATPDWLRPGMQALDKPGTILPPGEPDSYAQYFYDHLNPLTHLDSYAHIPEINFVCGDIDTHVPPDGALRFQAALQAAYPPAADRVQVSRIPGAGHSLDSGLWWPDVLAWLTRPAR